MSLSTTIRRALVRMLYKPSDYYEGARTSIRRSALQGGLQDARFDASSASLYELRRKARYFERNSCIVNRLADLWEQYTVGNGLVVQPASSDSEWNANAATWWSYWAELPDVSTRQPLGTVLSMLSRGWFIDGEQFVLLVKGDSGMPRVQVIEAHRVSTPPDLRGDPTVIDGIRVDAQTLRPLAYFVSQQELATRATVWREVAAQFVIHLFEPSRPGQLRGLPFLHPSINTLHDLDDLQMLEMSAAKDAAKTSKVIKTSPAEFNPATLAAARVRGSLPLSDGSTAPVDKIEYYDTALGEGKVILRPGDEYNQFATARPSVVTREYWEYLAELVCIGTGIPYVLAFPDSMQGTVYRGAIDSAASFFALRSSVIQEVVNRLYQYAMGWARYTQPLLLDAPADWKKIRIAPPRAVNVDVGRNSKAMLEEIAGGANTFSKSYAALGQDWRQELRQRAEEAAFIKQLADEYDLDVSEISVLLRERTQSTSTPPADKVQTDNADGPDGPDNPDDPTTDGEATTDDEEETANA